MWQALLDWVLGLFRASKPQVADFESLIARYEEHAERREQEHAADLEALVKRYEERERGHAADIAALKRAERSCQKELAAVREELAQERQHRTELQAQVWEMSAILDALDAVRKIKEDPGFQARTVAHVRELMLRRTTPPEAADDANPPG